MKLRCLHGYFIFEETKVGQVADYVAYSGLQIVPRGTYFTFDFISQALEFSLKSQPYLNLSALVNFEGEPWEVFAANGFVYDFNKAVLVPIESVTQVVSIKQSLNKFVSNGLILPGSLTDGGKRVKDYAAHFSNESLRWVYSEVTYV